LKKREEAAAGKWTIIKIDIDLEGLAEIVNQHQITGVPTIAFYNGNKKVYQKTGFGGEADFVKL